MSVNAAGRWATRLNEVPARDLVSRTRVSRLLAGYWDRPRANVDAVWAVLVSLSHLVESRGRD